MVPSDTYTLSGLGLGAALVGRTEYCVHPVEVVSELPAIGGTKNVDVEAVARL